MFISTVVCLVPVVDCSEAVGIVEMTEVSYYNCVTRTCSRSRKAFFVFIRRIDIHFSPGLIL